MHNAEFKIDKFYNFMCDVNILTLDTMDNQQRKKAMTNLDRVMLLMVNLILLLLTHIHLLILMMVRHQKQLPMNTIPMPPMMGTKKIHRNFRTYLPERKG